jgi:hypothetical protein
VIKHLWCALLLCAAAFTTACTAQLRPAPPKSNAGPTSPPAPSRTTLTPRSTAELAAAIEIAATRSDNETDPKLRTELATQAVNDAEECLARNPQAAACLYGRAVALGLSARAHPTHAGEILSSMLENLARAESADSNYDEAGPARVRALVLIRAPGWPLGPGDAEAGLVAARRAVALRPLYPPNLLALAEALSKNGDSGGARDNYARARDAARALPDTAARDQWLREADQGLQRK